MAVGRGSCWQVGSSGIRFGISVLEKRFVTLHEEWSLHFQAPWQGEVSGVSVLKPCDVLILPVEQRVILSVCSLSSVWSCTTAGFFITWSFFLLMSLLLLYYFSASFLFFFLLPTACNPCRTHQSLFPLLAIGRGLFYQSLDHRRWWRCFHWTRWAQFKVEAAAEPRDMQGDDTFGSYQ